MNTPAAFYSSVLVGAVVYEYKTEAAAGVTLTTVSVRNPAEPDDDSVNRRWFGTRVMYRPAGTRRWERRILIDVHPFDFAGVEAGIKAATTREA